MTTAFARLHVHIAGGGGQRGMTQRVLHHMHGGAPVQRMAGMGMTQPVRRDPVREAGPQRGGADNLAAGPAQQGPARPGAKHRAFRLRRCRLQGATARAQSRGSATCRVRPPLP